MLCLLTNAHTIHTIHTTYTINTTYTIYHSFFIRCERAMNMRSNSSGSTTVKERINLKTFHSAVEKMLQQRRG